MKNPANTFEVSIAARATIRFVPASVESSAIGWGRPRKRGTPTCSLGQRNATGWSSGFSRSQRELENGDQVNRGRSNIAGQFLQWKSSPLSPASSEAVVKILE
jgi:hypothetical protein